MRKHSTPSERAVDAAPALLHRVGFLLVTPTGATLFANREAMRILRYTEALDIQFRLTLKQAARILFAPNAPPDQGWSTLFVSGQRRYRCSGIAFGLEKQRLVAFLIERLTSKLGTLAGGRDKYRLTSREQETVALLANGLTNKEIAARMDVSANTVKAFIRSAMLKMDVSTRAGIVGRLFEEPAGSTVAERLIKRTNPSG